MSEIIRCGNCGSELPSVEELCAVCIPPQAEHPAPAATMPPKNGSRVEDAPGIIAAIKQALGRRITPLQVTCLERCAEIAIDAEASRQSRSMGADAEHYRPDEPPYAHDELVDRPTGIALALAGIPVDTLGQALSWLHPDLLLAGLVDNKYRFNGQDELSDDARAALRLIRAAVSKTSTTGGT